MAKGYVYILTNPCIQMPDGCRPVKIGKATRMAERLGTLDTSVPIDFEVYRTAYCEGFDALETKVHDILDDYRIGRTEFFTCTKGEAIAALREAARQLGLTEVRFSNATYDGRSAVMIKHKMQLAMEKGLICCTKKIRADGLPHENDDGITVKKGSQVAPLNGKMQIHNRSYYVKRQELERKGFIKDGVFQNDVAFDSMSEAASVVLGRSANGHTEWKLEEERR